MVSLPQTTILYIKKHSIEGTPPYLLMSSEQTSFVVLTVAIKTTVNTKKMTVDTKEAVTISLLPESILNIDSLLGTLLVKIV